ncbi:MAG: ribonuclease III [Candidatus Dormibacteria bacterium]
MDIKFKRREWLLEAMTHTSWINERGAAGRDNERLEYLGDAVLELVAAEYLFNRFPNYDEGQLTQMRSSLVSTVALAGIGERLRLGEALRLGRGATKSGARRLTSLHANAFEAIIGATFLDQGYRKAGKIFLSRIGDLSSWTDPNFKGRLQALAQERFGMPPIYRTLPDGSSRPRQYHSQVSVEGGPVLGEGRGGTKQAAEQGAARAAIDGLVAPVSKKRRRGSRSKVAATDSADHALTAPSLQPVAPETSPVVGPALGGAAEPPTPSSSPPARKRRRRSRASSGGVANGLSPAEAAAPTPGDEGAAPAVALTALEAVSNSSEATAPRRRRRRARGGTVGAGPDSAPPRPAPGDLEPAQVFPAAGSDTEVTGEPASGRRRRRRPRSGAPSSSGSPLIPAPGESGPETLPQEQRTPVSSEMQLESPSKLGEPTDPGQRKRTHRGHRGGRRRSGRPASPTP